MNKYLKILKQNRVDSLISSLNFKSMKISHLNSKLCNIKNVLTEFFSDIYLLPLDIIFYYVNHIVISTNGLYSSFYITLK